MDMRKSKYLIMIPDSNNLNITRIEKLKNIRCEDK